jgi:hypothetical protein
MDWGLQFSIIDFEKTVYRYHPVTGQPILHATTSGILTGN